MRQRKEWHQLRKYFIIALEMRLVKINVENWSFQPTH
jgi:hypothetical protein